MRSKIDKTIAYYSVKQTEILKKVNQSNNLTVEDIIQFGEEMTVLEHKITALEVAKEN